MISADKFKHCFKKNYNSAKVILTCPHEYTKHEGETIRLLWRKVYYIKKNLGQGQLLFS